MSKTWGLLTTLVCCLGFTLGSCGEEGAASANASEGERLYLQNCSICHGKDGQLGAARAKNLATSTLNEAQSLQAIQKGSPKMGMPAYEKRLNPEQLQALNTYVMSLRKKQ